MKALNHEKLSLTENGPFPQQIDPWIEESHYFNQLHRQMITNLMEQLQGSAIKLGYLMGRELSNQNYNTLPDLSLTRLQAYGNRRNYDFAVETLELEAGLIFQNDTTVNLDRLYFNSADTGRLVTVIELISPKQKTEPDAITLYTKERNFLLNTSVDVVEIDLTRSIRHFINNSVARTFPYHIAIHLYDRLSRFWGIRLGDNPKAFALPLEEQVLAVDLNQSYRQSYSHLMLAFQMANDGHYQEENLSFPSTLSDKEREALMEAVKAWLDAIK